MRAPSNSFFWEYLIVCKDAGVHKMLAAAINATSGSASYTADTSLAMAYITRRKLDGIFIDTRTEGALNLVGSIRRGNSNRYAVVFACAGESEDAGRLLNAGANFVVRKPLDPQEIGAVLKSASLMMDGERLRYLRYPLTLPVVLKVANRERKAVTSNISRGGMAVRGQELLEPGSAVHFVLELPFEEPLIGRGEVAWTNTDGLMGIRFCLLGEAVKKTLWRWIDQTAMRLD